jgi:hypothetical protein
LYHSTLWGRVGDPLFFFRFLPFKKAPEVVSVGLRYCQSKPRLTVCNSSTPRFRPGSVGQDIPSQLLHQPQTLPVLSRFCLFICFVFFPFFFVLLPPLDETDTGRPIRHGRSLIKIK